MCTCSSNAKDDIAASSSARNSRPLQHRGRYTDNSTNDWSGRLIRQARTSACVKQAGNCDTVHESLTNTAILPPFRPWRVYEKVWKVRMQNPRKRSDETLISVKIKASKKERREDVRTHNLSQCFRMLRMLTCTSQIAFPFQVVKKFSPQRNHYKQADLNGPFSIDPLKIRRLVNANLGLALGFFTQNPSVSGTSKLVADFLCP